MNRRLLNVIVTEISEQLNDLIQIKTEHGTLQCCPASEHLLNRPNSCILGIDSCWTWTVLTVLSSALCSKMFTSWNTCCLKIKHKRKVSALLLIVIIILFLLSGYHTWITHVWLLWVWINIAFWSLYCALFFAQKWAFSYCGHWKWCMCSPGSYQLISWLPFWKGSWSF